MEWTCTDCGSSATAPEEVLVRTMGWKITRPSDALCPLCVRKGYRRPQAYASLTAPVPRRLRSEFAK
jgi:hypothetical protein